MDRSVNTLIAEALDAERRVVSAPTLRDRATRLENAAAAWVAVADASDRDAAAFAAEYRRGPDWDEIVEDEL